MLVLTRRTGEEIRLPDLDITIRVLKASGGRTTIGIEAPRRLRIVRGELEPAGERDGCEPRMPWSPTPAPKRQLACEWLAN